MDYIVHHRFRNKGICGQLNLPYGTELTVIGGFISLPDGRRICYPTSENAHRYFARNDDGRGLERGKLTYAIAYSNRKKLNNDGHYYRLSDEEREILRRDWAHFLLPYDDVVLFNHDFFNADVSELHRLADALHIKVKGE